MQLPRHHIPFSRCAIIDLHRTFGTVQRSVQDGDNQICAPTTQRSSALKKQINASCKTVSRWETFKSFVTTCVVLQCECFSSSQVIHSWVFVQRTFTHLSTSTLANWPQKQQPESNVVQKASGAARASDNKTQYGRCFFVTSTKMLVQHFSGERFGVFFF